MAKEKRFVKLYEESIGLMGAAYILVDTQTGVHYLVAQNGTIGGLTPLLDAEGRPVITLADVEEKEKGIYGN
ncbi:MAG TPA: xylan 1,4-beta-xylosidase [Candidatus Merdivicinus intestinavium]|nr:xylan 1,4-beta-xylosidase [Candidatus Merdivicinus intestinavium]